MHIPVMLQETVDCLAVRPGGVYLDATLGEAGHAVEILRRAAPGGRLLGIDRDPVAIARASARLQEAAPGAAVCVQGNHADLGVLADEHGFPALDGVVIDTGVSSGQLDEAERGFSFTHDGPLDMRMDPDAALTAAQIVNNWPAEEIRRILWDFGEERYAGAISRAIVARRGAGTFQTTADLAATIAAAMPAAAQTTAQATAQVTILEPLSLVNTADMNFGRISNVSAGGTVGRPCRSARR